MVDNLKIVLFPSLKSNHQRGKIMCQIVLVEKSNSVLTMEEKIKYYLKLIVQELREHSYLFPKRYFRFKKLRSNGWLILQVFLKISTPWGREKYTFSLISSVYNSKVLKYSI